MLTQLDSALLIIVIFPFALFFLQKEMITTPKKLIKMLLLILPFTIFVGSWFIWKLSYYGDILPNTFYVKVSSPTSIKLGVFYFYLFLFSYWLIPFLFLGLIALKGLLKKENLAIVISLILIVVWSLYVIKVGGDFLEFRFIVPILPLVFIVITWLTLSFIQQKEIQIVLIALVLLGSLHHTITFAVLTNKLEIESIKQLYGHLKNSNENWAEIGRVFGKIFDYNPNVTIAVTAAGAIPFYSRLKTIDMLGLNDRWVAKYGDVIGTRPGHQRRAPFSYLLERKVNIVIAHPWLIRNDSNSEKKYTIEHLETFGVKNEDEVPPHASIIEIPIDQNYRLVTLYLTRSPIVDEAIQRYCLDEYPILR
ncbi:hypothetical protein IIA15_07940 [candidate division TA06 bacterium]|nr:hypothetical protein [candidate division TA06 bacterium]